MRSPRLPVIGGVLLVVIAAVLAFNALRPAPAAASLVIDPARYQNEFSSAPHLLLDVRTAEEFASGHIPGAVNISIQELSSRLSEVPTDLPVVLYCRSGNRSAQALGLLQGAGYTNVYDMGGIIAWQAAGLPVE